MGFGQRIPKKKPFPRFSWLTENGRSAGACCVIVSCLVIVLQRRCIRIRTIKDQRSGLANRFFSAWLCRISRIRGQVSIVVGLPIRSLRCLLPKLPDTMDFYDERFILHFLSYNLDQLISKTRIEFSRGAQDQYNIRRGQVR
jgi:hypothetical protein